MNTSTAPTQNNAPADCASRYLLRCDDDERRRWGERAVELGFPREQLRTRETIFDLLPWIPFVEKEMIEQGLVVLTPPVQEPEKKTAQIIQLPLWPEPVRAVPNDILRSALFAAIQGKTRRFLNKETIACVDGVTIQYYGQQLDQSDLDVWEQAVHMARGAPLGNVVRFRANTFLKNIVRHNGKSQYEWLDDAITRLVGCAVIIKSGSRAFTGSLLSSCIRDEKTGIYELTLDPKTIKLYTTNNWTGIEWEQRQTLIGKPLALWLHGYYSSHAAPFGVKVDTLRELCGSNDKTLRSYRQKLRRALDDLKVCGAIAAWQIDPTTDLVNVDRGAAITDSQRRHLTKPKRQPRKPKN